MARVITKGEWCLLSCFSGELTPVSAFPFEIGSSETAHLRLPAEEGIFEKHCAILQAGKKKWLVKRNPNAGVLLDGVPFDQPVELAERTDYTLKVGAHLFLIRGDQNLMSWRQKIHVDRWILQNAQTGDMTGPFSFEGLGLEIAARDLDPEGVITTVDGAEKGFYLRDLMELIPQPDRKAVERSVAEAAGAEQAERSSADYGAPEIDVIRGEFTCPICWKRFDRKDVLWVARHPSLMGLDADLGEESMLRFRATNFNDRGLAFDAKGVVCSEKACPHCKRRLPPGFLELETFIFSIVGAPSAGKSYFLTSAIKQLEDVLPLKFQLALQDADAEGNATVSQMKARMFSDSENPADIYLDKTQPGGEMYETWERDGKQVRLPKPFTYMVSSFSNGNGPDAAPPVTLVFYDNAGEHFEPSLRSESSDEPEVQSTQHLASSSVIFFLFDPTSNVGFRKQLKGLDDPQLHDGKFTKLDRQDSILAEMRNRIKRELNIEAHKKIGVPIAVLVGKCDTWSHLLSNREQPFADPLAGSSLNIAATRENSRRVREFLLKTCPNIVAGAEAISEEVCYFPVSPIGHSPKEFTRKRIVGGEEREETLLGPVPGCVKPIFAEIPVLWALSKICPKLVPSSGDPPDGA